ncbi:MAG TPA: putative sugar nucleotidyl transferase [Balneolales bacterium]|nr:putative sugar nucleotidyl transferase [Balneolales bacterium]
MFSICLFEDKELKHLHPLTLTRPVDQLRIGVFTLAEKWKLLLATDIIHRLIRPELRTLFPTKPFPKDENILWIRARYIPERSLRDDLLRLKPGEGLQYKGISVAALVDSKKSLNFIKQGEPDFSSVTFSTTNHGWLLSRPTQLFEFNGLEIAKDFTFLNPTQKTISSFPHVAIEGTYPVYMEEGVSIEPGSVILSHEGPVYLGREAKLLAGAIVRGPAVIGSLSVLKMAAKIYKNTTIGPYCKVGGEVNNVIFIAHSNKSHEGYLGNSVIGEWCNLGADTNNSNLKNNYSKVRLPDWTTGEPYDTGLQFCGTVMGDHCKTAINTMINTGSMFGVSCNIATDTFPPKYLPSFSWLTSKGLEPYDFEKAMETAKAMMGRRDIEVSEAYRSLMKSLYPGKET